MRRSILFTATLLLFLGCSDKEESNENTTVKEATAGHIEVVENSEYRAVKAQELDSKDIATGAKANAFYYDYGKNNKVIKKEKTYTPLEANMRVRTPYDEVNIGLLVRRLSKDFIIKCSACHNDYANGIIGPSLIGKDRTFIYDSIMDFKTGKKTNVLMNDLINRMSNEEIDKLAQEIAEFNKKIKELRVNWQLKTE